MACGRISLSSSGGRLLGGNGSRKNREVVVEFLDTGGKAFERDVARFMHCMSHRALLLGKGINREKITE